MNHQPKILVVGDAMSDYYWIATTDRVSPEAPIPVCRVLKTINLPGGAANVTANLKALGAEVRLVHGNAGVVGAYTDDGYQEEDDNYIIPVKHRLMVGDTQIARWDLFDKVNPISTDELQETVDEFKPNAIIVSDYDKGSINCAVIKAVTFTDVPLFIDTKHSPVWFPTDATFFPNYAEYLKWEGAYNACEHVVSKCGSDGVKFLRYGSTLEQFKAKARQVTSVCGAGDVVLANYVYNHLLGRRDALYRANLAAAVAVQKPYTATVTNDEIDEFAKELAA